MTDIHAQLVEHCRHAIDTHKCARDRHKTAAKRHVWGVDAAISSLLVDNEEALIRAHEQILKIVGAL